MVDAGGMDKQYSVQFFTSFLETLQNVCQQYLNYSQFVEVSGYVCVEIDNMKKERYVLSELLQSSGNVVSESYCTKACLTRTKNVPQMNTKPQPLASNRNRMNRYQTIKKTAPDHCVSNRNGPRMCMTSSSSLDGSIRGDERRERSMGSADIKQTQFSGRFDSTSQHYTVRSGQRTIRQSKGPSMQLPAGSESVGFVNNSMRVSEGSEVNVRLPQCITNESGENAIQSEPTARTDEDLLQDNTHSPSLTISSCYSLKEEVEQESDPIASVPSVLDEDVIDLDMIEDEESEVQAVADAYMEDSMYQNVQISFDSDVHQTPRPNYDFSQKGHNVMSPGSKHVMKSAIKQFQRYHFEKSGQDVDLFATSPEQLNDLLLDFYQGGRKLDGKELTPGSLKNVQIYLDKYLREGGYLYSISKDDYFKTSRDFIRAKVSDNSRQIVAQRHIPVSDRDIEVLFQTNQLGTSSPDALINTMWILNSKLFGIKGPTEHFNLKWGDIYLATDSEGREYLARPAKAMETFNLKVLANTQNPERCFVGFYKAYQAVRPKLMMDDTSAFYLKANKVPSQDAWYQAEAVSWSSLTNLWKRMVVAAGLPINKKIL